MKRAKVIFQDVHVSGHACQEEIKLIYSLVRPKYAIPVHGEYRHLTAQKRMVEIWVSRRKYLYPCIRQRSWKWMKTVLSIGSVQTGAILVDGLGVGDHRTVMVIAAAEPGCWVVCHGHWTFT